MTTAVSITTIFDTARRTATEEPELRTLAASLQKRRQPAGNPWIYCFIDDEVALQLLCATYGGRYPRPRLDGTALKSQQLREFEWCAVYPVPTTAFATVARRYGPGARNVIVLGTAARPVDPEAGTDSKLPAWQLAESTIYIGEQVILFPTATGTAAESPKDLTAVYLELGLLGVLTAAGNPPLDVVLFNPRQKDMAAYHGGRLLERVLAGTFAP